MDCLLADDVLRHGYSCKTSKDAAWDQSLVRYCALEIINASMPEQIRGATGKLRLLSGTCTYPQTCTS